MSDPPLPKLYLKLADDVRLDLIGVVHWIRTSIDPNDWDTWLLTLETLFMWMAKGHTDQIRSVFHEMEARRQAQNLDDELARLLSEESE